MHLFINLFLYFGLFNNAYLYNVCINSTAPKILNTLSGKVMGECYEIPINFSNNKTVVYDVYRWLSVPYAEPPINENRFKQPIPVKKWEKTLDGTKWPNMCMQIPFNSSDLSIKFRQNLTTQNMSEDCLYLNIFVSSRIYRKVVIEKNLYLSAPIYVFIHGGGFVSGSSSEDIFDPSTFVAATNIIVITLNYRLGAFGFLYLNDTEATGNQGFLDQNIALSWIYQNAYIFGGDETRITIGGHGAGAFFVGYHLMYEPSWHFFRNAILLSGSPFNKGYPFISPARATNRTKMFLDMLGCDINLNNTEALNCAKTIEPNELVYQTEQFTYELFDRNFITASHNIFAFPLVQNKKDFNFSIEETFQMKKFKRCKMMIGFVENGASSLLNLKEYFGFEKKNLTENVKINKDYFISYLNSLYKYYPSYPKKSNASFTKAILKEYNITENNTRYFEQLTRIITDQMFACPCFKLAEIYSAFTAYTDVFVYKYSHRISTSFYPVNYSTVHGDELPMFFGELISVKKQPLNSINFWSSTVNNYTVKEKKFSEKMIRYLSNFISFDNPNYDLNYEKNNIIDEFDDLEYWPLFKYDFKVLLNQTKKSTNNGNYLTMKASSNRIFKGYNLHKCEFWGLNHTDIDDF